MNGNLLREWNSIKEAGDVLHITRSNISACLTNPDRNMTYKGSLWRYKTDVVETKIQPPDIPEVHHAVLQYSTEGTFIKKWDTMIEIAKTFGMTPSSISFACGHHGTLYGYQWRYMVTKNIPMHIPSFADPRLKPVYQYDDYGNLIKRWDSISSAGEQFDDKGSISQCLRGKSMHAHGFVWKFE